MVEMGLWHVPLWSWLRFWIRDSVGFAEEGKDRYLEAHPQKAVADSGEGHHASFKQAISRIRISPRGPSRALAPRPSTTTCSGSGRSRRHLQFEVKAQLGLSVTICRHEILSIVLRLAKQSPYRLLKQFGDH